MLRSTCSQHSIVSARRNWSNIAGPIRQEKSFWPTQTKRSALHPYVQFVVPCPPGRMMRRHGVHDLLPQPRHLRHGPGDDIGLAQQVEHEPLRSAHRAQAVDPGVQVGIGGDPPVPLPRSTEARRISRYFRHHRLPASMRKSGKSAQSSMNGFVQEVLSFVLKERLPPSQAANWSGPSHGLWIGRASAAKRVRESASSVFSIW